VSERNEEEMKYGCEHADSMTFFHINVC